MFKRMMAIFLCLCMLHSVFPVAVFAEGEGSSATEIVAEVEEPTLAEKPAPTEPAPEVPASNASPSEDTDSENTENVTEEKTEEKTEE